VPTLADKIAFAAKHLKTKEGVCWSLKGREWVRDEFWLPADGWKLWRRDGADHCKDCLEHAGEIIEHPSDNPTHGCSCGGLTAEPILVTILNLDRGDGKTFNLMAYSLATLFKSRNKSIAALWASEDQGSQIFRETWQAAIEQAPALRKRCDIHGTPPQIWDPKTRCRMEVLTASHSSVTGRRRTHILIDEARDIDARTVIALLPSINAMHGYECPAGHVQLTPEELEAMAGNIPEKCSVCGERLGEWWPRIIMASAAGILDGTEKDWLYELVEELEAHPHPNYHLFTSQKWGRPLNPRKSAKVTGALESVFGILPSTRHYMAAESGNQWTRKGEDVASIASVKRVMDASLHNEEGSSRPCVGFLDTSTSVEKTSLVILAEEEDSEQPWQKVYLSYLEFWWPGHGRCMSTAKIPDQDVRRAVETILPLYTGLVDFQVDLKASVANDKSDYLWPTIMLRELRKGAGAWRGKLRGWSQDGDASDVGWDLFLGRLDAANGQTIRLQYSAEILDEFKGLMRRTPKFGDRKAVVTDRNRRTMHKDITQSIACCCWLIAKQQMRARAGTSIAERLRRTSTAKAATEREARPPREASAVFGRLGENSW
jgi:hypothetical protein